MTSKRMAATLSIGRVFESLFLNPMRALPNDVAGIRVNQFKGIEHIIARAGSGFRGLSHELAGEEEVGALELIHIRIAAAGDLAALFEFAFPLQISHALASQKTHFARGFFVEHGHNLLEKNVLVDR